MDHRCRRGQRCPDNEQLDDGTTVGRAINVHSGLCETCQKHTERAIRELPADYVELNTILGKGSTVGGEPISMTKDLPIPIRQHIEALQRDMVREAVNWAESTCAVMHHTWEVRGGVRPGWLLDRACRVLTGNPSAFLALRDEKHTRWEYGHLVTVARDGLDGALEFLRLHQKARSFSGKTVLRHDMPVPCPRCEAMALQREDGDETIHCRECGRAYTWDEYEKLCYALADRRFAVR